MQVSAKVHRCSMTAVKTGHGSQAAVADLAAIDCKRQVRQVAIHKFTYHILVPVLLSNQDLPYSTCLVDTQRAVLCLAL